MFKFMATNTQYRDKPRGIAIACARKNMRVVGADETKFCDMIANGHAWTPGVLVGGSTRDDWASQQLIGLDFDNSIIERDVKPYKKRALRADEAGYISAREVFQRLMDVGITPMCIYYSYSSSKDNPRYRMVLCLDEACEDPDVMHMAIERLLYLFPEADSSCSDIARLFFGTNGEVHRVWNAAVARSDYHRTDIRDILKLPEKPKDVFRVYQAQKKRETYKNAANHVDVDKLIADTDLLAIVQRDTGECGHKSSKYVKFDVCPICGHHDCFAFNPETNSWVCFSSSNMSGRGGGSVIDYVMARDGLEFKDALSVLQG